MFKLQGIQTQLVNIEIRSLKDLLDAITLEYFKTNKFYSLVIKDGYICEEYDVSYHGSPIMEYKQITNDPDLIEVYNALEILYKFNSKKSK